MMVSVTDPVMGFRGSGGVDRGRVAGSLISIDGQANLWELD